MRRKFRPMLTLLALSVLGLWATFSAPAALADSNLSAKSGAILMNYHGKTVPFTDDWNGAQGCAAVSPTLYDCYDTVAELNAATAQPASVAQPDGFNCSNYTNLFDGPNTTGRELRYKDWGYWQSTPISTAPPFPVHSETNPSTCKAYLRDASSNCWYIAPGVGNLNMTFISVAIFVQNPSNPPAPGC